MYLAEILHKVLIGPWYSVIPNEKSVAKICHRDSLKVYGTQAKLTLILAV